MFFCCWGFSRLWIFRQRGKYSLVSADVEQTEEIRPKIATDFDDGPSAAYTEKLLDGLRERDVHGYVFPDRERILKKATMLCW